MKEFKTLEQLHAEWEVNGACPEGVTFNKSCATLQEVFEKCPLKFRIWRLINGYSQFAENCEWEKLKGDDWGRLLIEQPQFAAHCDWSKLNGDNWSYLLVEQPQFAAHCAWEKLNGYDWIRLLRNQPQFEKFKLK